MKIGVIFANLLEKAGLDPTDEKYKDALSVGIEVDHEAEKALNGLFSFEAAKNNPELKKLFYANAYGGLDMELVKRAERLGDSEFFEIIKNEKSTGKKQQLLLDKLEELKGSAASSGDKESEKVLKEQIKLLNSEVAKFKESYIPKDELTKKEQEFENERLNSIIESTFAGQKWSESYMPELRSDVGKIALNKKLAEMGAKLVRDGNSVKLVQAQNPEMDYFDSSNKNVKFDSLVSDIMHTNKFIAVSTPVTPTQTPISGISTPGTKVNSATDKALQQSMQAAGLTS